MLCGALLLPCLAIAEPLPYHGWILTQNDPAYNRSVIARLGEYGVTHVQLSHSIIDQIDALGDEAVADRVQTLARDIHAQGAEVAVWSHELGIDRLTFCFDPQSADMQARMQVYRQALRRVPEIDGVVLVFGSAASEIYVVQPSCHPEKYLSPVERYKAVIEALAQVVMDEFGKRLYISDFYHKAFEIPILRQALAETRRPIVVMSKTEPNDFEPYYPLSPLIGSVGEHDQILDLDCAGEYWGQSQLPFVAVEYFVQRFRESRQALAAGSGRFAGSACRVDRYEHSAFDGANLANIDAHAALVRQPDADWRDILRRHIESHYGLPADSAANGELLRLLQRTYWIGRKMYYAKGDWAFRKGSNLPISNWGAFEILLDKSISQWDPSYLPITAQLVTPNRQTLLELLQEKQEAVDLAEENLEHFAALREKLEPDAAENLQSQLLKQHWATHIWFNMAGALFATRHCLTHVESHFNDDTRAWVPWHVGELRRLADALEQQDFDPYPFPAEEIRALADSFRLGSGEARPAQWLRIQGIDLGEVGAHSVGLQWIGAAGITYRVQLSQKLPDYQVVSADIQGTGPLSASVSGLAPDSPYWLRIQASRADESMVSGDYPFWTGRSAP